MKTYLNKTLIFLRPRLNKNSSALTHRTRVVILSISAKELIKMACGRVTADTTNSLSCIPNLRRDGQEFLSLLFHQRKLLVTKMSSSSTREDSTLKDSSRNWHHSISSSTRRSSRTSPGHKVMLSSSLMLSQRLILLISLKDTRLRSILRIIFIIHL